MADTTAPGPYETEQAARQAAARYPTGILPGDGIMEANRAMLNDAVIAAGLHLGAYDQRILEWLTKWEPATCAVIAGLITRAAKGSQA